MLSEIHKEQMPGCIIKVSFIYHFMNTFSEFIDLHPRSYVEDMPSYFKDTTDYMYLSKTHSFGLPDHYFVTIDVIFLYTNI